jgi:hypothetical protein
MRQKIAQGKVQKGEDSTVRPAANQDKAIKEIDEFTMISLPDYRMYQKGYREKLFLS